jgi:hypothetical protein
MAMNNNGVMPIPTRTFAIDRTEAYFFTATPPCFAEKIETLPFAAGQPP